MQSHGAELEVQRKYQRSAGRGGPPRRFHPRTQPRAARASSDRHGRCETPTRRMHDTLTRFTSRHGVVAVSGVAHQRVTCLSGTPGTGIETVRR
jgi:hypothetical protein